MSSSTTNAFSDFRTRRIRDANGLIIQVRQWGVNASLGAVCKVINVNRDSSTKLITETWTDNETVTQEDLDSITI